jgi:RNA polymerase sigma-70 factor (ECF subfamily)
MAEAERIPLADDAVADEVLVQEILDGRPEAFDLLYKRYIKRIYSFVDKRLHNRADTEETVQEVFIAVFYALESFRGEAAFAAWVLGIARRTVANRFKRKRHPTIPLELDDEPSLVDLLIPAITRGATPLEDYEARERVERLEAAATEALSAEQRKLFELHHLEHRSISEIANRLHKSEDSVKSNLYRARKVLLSR